MIDFTKPGSPVGQGKVSGYRDNKPRIEWFANKMLEGAVKVAIEEFVKTKKELLAKEISKFFQSKKGSSLLIKAIEEGICESLTNGWRTTIRFEPPK